MKETDVWLTVRNGDIRLRLVDAEVRDGKLWARTKRGLGPVIDGELAKADGADLAAIQQALRAGDYGAIPQKYLASPGESASGLLIIRESEWQERQRRARGEQIYGRELSFSSDNRPVLLVDVREPVPLGEAIGHAGCTWRVISGGNPFARGDAHQVRYWHLEHQAVADAAVAYRELRALLATEEIRYSRQFAAMMEDEDNDGAAPPRSVPALLRTILKSIEASAPEVVARDQLRRDVAKAIATSPAGNLGYLIQAAGERAKKLMVAGASEAEVREALASYQQAPGYTDAAWGD